ncbi:MAG: hypothetical protein VX583_01705 [Bdellovibrionota bacterium]|nr:hypothetical protein [Pseudobdellovibrionaceae bacterium]
MKHFSVAIFLFLFAPLNSFAFQQSDLSAGLVLGTPTGLSAKYQLNSLNHVQADIGTNYFAADYMWRHRYKFSVPNLTWFYGAGVAYKEEIGGRVLASIEYQIDNSPFTAFANTSFTLTDKARPGIALGCRFHF